jgi:hypothetical protein
MTKKLIILFVAVGATCICRAQGVTLNTASLTDTPAAAFSAQTPPSFAIKTNLLYWASIVPDVTPNLGIEFGLSKKMTFNISGGYNPWKLKGSDESNKKLVHWIVNPELRYWFCERFNGASIGLHGIYSQYNVGQYDIPLLFEKAFRYEGVAYGGGVSYNYHWMVGKHFGLELSLGAGFAYMLYDKYDCPRCSEKINRYSKSYLGPTKLGINLIYVIK